MSGAGVEGSRSPGLSSLNELPAAEAESQLLACCGSRAWARRVADARPFHSFEHLLQAADEVWWSLGRDDWLEAFAAHPRIGERKPVGGEAHAASPRRRVAASESWSEQEQSGTRGAGEDVKAALAAGNVAYEERFGHVFLICATGKTADEMLAALHERLANDPQTELRVAAEEQRRITHLRLEKLLRS